MGPIYPSETLQMILDMAKKRNIPLRAPVSDSKMQDIEQQKEGSGA